MQKVTDPRCPIDLLGMAYVETHFKCEAVGKAGETGCFQIMPFNGGPKGSFTADASWTLQRLVRHGYPKNRTWAIQCHNSCNKTTYIKKVNKATKIIPLLYAQASKR